MVPLLKQHKYGGGGYDLYGNGLAWTFLCVQSERLFSSLSVDPSAPPGCNMGEPPQVSHHVLHGLAIYG